MEKKFTSYTVSKWFPKHRGFSLFIKKTFFPDAVKHILILSVLKSLLKVQTTCSEQKLINPPILNDMTTADKAFQILLLYSWALNIFSPFFTTCGLHVLSIEQIQVMGSWQILIKPNDICFFFRMQMYANRILLKKNIASGLISEVRYRRKREMITTS